MLPIIFISLTMLVAAVVFVWAMISIFKSVRRGSLPAAMVSPEVARKHFALICLIRVPQILFAAALGMLFAAILLGFLLSLNPFQHQSASREVYSVVMWIITLMVAAAIIARSIDSHRKSESQVFRGLLRVDTNSISTFALIFAAFTAHDLYQMMPPWKPVHMSLSSQFLDRDFLWIAVFFLGRSCITTILTRILEINRQSPPQNPKPPDDSGSGPQDPFDPFILPNNRPLLPSGS